MFTFILEDPLRLLFISLLHGAVIMKNGKIWTLQTDTRSDRSKSNHSHRKDGEKNYKIPILLDRETDLTKRNSRLWWKQIAEYIALTYQNNLDELMNLGTDSLDAQISYNIKGDVNWPLRPKANHEIMRGQLGKKLKYISLQELLKPIKKTFLPTRNKFYCTVQFVRIKQEENETLDEYWKTLVDIKRMRN